VDIAKVGDCGRVSQISPYNATLLRKTLFADAKETLLIFTLGEGMADTRRRVERSELYPRGVDPDAVNAVIDRLSGKDARILVTTRAGGKAEDLASGEDFVEFTHEALLSNWEHLVKLLETERTSIRRHREGRPAFEVFEHWRDGCRHHCDGDVGLCVSAEGKSNR
jgi:Novel STAND NTPase 1